MQRAHKQLAQLVFFAALSCSCGPSSRTVVVYTSVDQVYSEPIFKDFTARTGIRTLPVFDVEAAKTTGLVNRLIAEKGRPSADVFWSGEFAQTLELKERGVLASYRSPSADAIPIAYRDQDGFWTGFGGRVRVLIMNNRLMATARQPTSLFDLADSNLPSEQIGIANPLFGTSYTHAAALYAALGSQRAREFYRRKSVV